VKQPMKISRVSLSISGKNLVNRSGKVFVFSGYGIPRVVGCQADADGIVNVAPVGMVPSGFGGKSHLGHEGKGLPKISKLKVAVERVIFIGPGHLSSFGMYGYERTKSYRCLGSSRR